MANEMVFTNKTIDRNRVWDFIRPLRNQKTHDAVLVPKMTSGDYDLSRDTNDTDTIDGKITALADITVEPKVEVIDTVSPEVQYLNDSFMFKQMLEHWHVFLDRKNSEGKYFAYYSQVLVSEDSQSGDPGEFATREFTLTPQTAVKQIWTELPGAYTEQILDGFAAVGLKAVTTSAPTGTGEDAGMTEMPTSTDDED